MILWNRSPHSNCTRMLDLHTSCNIVWVAIKLTKIGVEHVQSRQNDVSQTWLHSWLGVLLPEQLHKGCLCLSRPRKLYYTPCHPAQCATCPQAGVLVHALCSASQSPVVSRNSMASHTLTPAPSSPNSSLRTISETRTSAKLSLCALIVQSANERSQ